MHRLGILLPALASVVLVPALAVGAATAGMRVTFVQPERFVDASLDRNFATGPDEPALSRLKAHLEALGQASLKPGQDLVVEILDVDLAGRLEWLRRSASEVRVVRDIDAPQITLRYTLAESGKPVRQGEERLTDLNFRWRAVRYFASDPLRYEKALLDDWFRDRIVQGRPKR